MQKRGLGRVKEEGKRRNQKEGKQRMKPPVAGANVLSANSSAEKSPCGYYFNFPT